jgi:predicted transposase/invertase (TIGR01784 family)
MKAKYVNPFTDFGFKKIFGEEASKPLLIDFLNALLPENDQIVDLTFKNNEQLAQTDLYRKATYDIYCENEKGEKFIVQLQKAKHNFFKERTVFYSTFPIREQAEKGEWNYELKAAYCIGILDFTFDDYENEPEKSEVVHTIKLKNQHGKTFYDKLTFIYLEMPNFNLKETELGTGRHSIRLDKWLYFIKHLEDFQTIPAIIADDVFSQAFEKAEIAKFGQKDLYDYEMNLKIYRDYKNTITTAFDEGKLEGKLEAVTEGKIEIAKSFKKLGVPMETIMAATGLTKEQIDGL